MQISKIFKRKKIVFIFLSVVVFIGALLFFYKFGIMQYFSLRGQKKDLMEKISQVEEKNQLLRSEIDSLNTKDSKIEKVAREKYHMVRKGEKVYRIEEK